MTTLLITLLLGINLMPHADIAQKTTPELPSKVEESVLVPNQTVRLKVRQILPKDGLSPGERLLNSLPPIQPGDRFLALSLIHI